MSRQSESTNVLHEMVQTAPPFTNASYKYMPQIQDKKESNASALKQTLCELDEFQSIDMFKRKWTIIKQIGWGGEGSVFEIKSKQKAGNKNPATMEFAAKITYFTNEDIYQSLEDRMLATYCIINKYKLVRNGNLLNYIDLYIDKTNYKKAMIVMEKLSDCLSTKRDCKWNGIFNIKRIAKNIANNIKEVHDLNYVHLDLKKGNIMFNKCEKKWKIIDYGFAKYIDPNIGFIKTNKFIGTKTWTPPEIKISENENECSILTKKCDIYSYGLLILNGALNGEYHYQIFMKEEFNIFSRNNLCIFSNSDIEILKMLNTQTGNFLLQNYLFELKIDEIIGNDLYDFLSQILQFDPDKRPNIDEILNLPYLRY